MPLLVWLLLPIRHRFSQKRRWRAKGYIWTVLCAYSQHELVRARSAFLPVRLAACKTLEAVIFASGANQWLNGRRAALADG